LSLFTITFLIYFTIVVIVKIRVFRIQGDKVGTLKDNWTFFAIYLSYFIVVWGSLAEFFLRYPQINPWLSTIGYLSATMGILITRYSVMTLGRLWSIRIEIKRDHHVVEKGPYRFSRHPYYLATLLELGGLCLILNSFRALLYLAFVHVPILLARTYSEERVLTASLGSSYRDYKGRVPMLPSVSSFSTLWLRK